MAGMAGLSKGSFVAGSEAGLRYPFQGKGSTLYWAPLPSDCPSVAMWGHTEPTAQGDAGTGRRTQVYAGIRHSTRDMRIQGRQGHVGT